MLQYHGGYQSASNVGLQLPDNYVLRKPMMPIDERMYVIHPHASSKRPNSRQTGEFVSAHGCSRRTATKDFCTRSNQCCEN